MVQDQPITQLRQTKYENVLDSNPGITLRRGMARFRDARTLVVTKAEGGEQAIWTDRILLTVGARPAIPPIHGPAETPYWTSTEALVAEDIHRHLVILSGSVVALELAQTFRHLGTEVTFMARSTLLSKEAPDIGARLKTVLESEDIKIELHNVPDSAGHDGQDFLVRTGKGDVHCDLGCWSLPVVARMRTRWHSTMPVSKQRRPAISSSTTICAPASRTSMLSATAPVNHGMSMWQPPQGHGRHAT